MKPPRVFIRSHHYYLRYSLSGRKYAVDKATGIEADTPNWKQSKHRRLILRIIEQVNEERLSRKMGLYHSIELARPGKLTFMDLLEKFNVDNEAEKGSPRAGPTLRHRALAVRTLQLVYPRATPQNLTRAQVLAIRTHLLKRTAPASVRGYFVELRMLMKYAVREGYAERNPFEGITVRVEAREPKEMPAEDEMRLFTFLYHHNPPLFFQAMFQRLTGLRALDVCNLTWDSIKGDTLSYRNSKGKRFERYPIGRAVRLLLTMLDQPKGFIFAFRDPVTVARYLRRACVMLDIEPIGTHQLKRSYARELAQEAPDERTFDMLLHHEPSINQLAVNYYSGRDLKLMLRVIDSGLTKWEKFLEHPPEDLWPDQTFSFANPKAHDARDRKTKVVAGSKHGIDFLE